MYHSSCTTRDERLRVLYFIEFRCYDASNKRRSGRANRIPFVVGRGIFLHKSEPRKTIQRPAALAVNQFRRGIDGSKSQFCRHSLLLSLSLSLNLSNFLSCLSIFFLLPFSPFLLLFPMFTRHPFDRKRAEIPSTEPVLRPFSGWIKVSSWKSYVVTFKRVFLATKGILGEGKIMNGNREDGGKVSRYQRITKVMMHRENDKSDRARLSRHRMTKDKN